jgi:hypothetical protein
MSIDELMTKLVEMKETKQLNGKEVIIIHSIHTDSYPLHVIKKDGTIAVFE